MSTEADLRDWRYGQIQAERLCAGLLSVSGYADIDPQSTLGGPDGKKDILARRDGRLIVAAVYFPSTIPPFSEVRAKFVSDRAGVRANGADGFAFFVNQHLPVGRRAELQRLGSPEDQVFHLERIRNLLDSPIGYGLRLEYLRRPMSEEEQVAFFSSVNQDQMQRLLRSVRETGQHWDGLGSSAISQLNPSALQLLHHAMVNDSRQSTIGGQLRGLQTTIRGQDGSPRFRPPPPEELPGRLTDFLAWWRGAYQTARGADRETVLRLLAEFHYGLVEIAPFLDGNGTLARLVVDQAARELLGAGIAPDLVMDRAAYYAALHSADNGNLDGLVGLIRAAFEPNPG
ncbi:hypothetical protein GCM10009744_64960 [Kribbella alba]|uniref:Fido domain-containing protein n=1 Tax=Kribbella alba TaxID=190197 RepID=A0ABN2FYN5_9ACTN